jgi:hypothetical protein
MNEKERRFYRVSSLAFMAIFIAVGLIFVCWPAAPLRFFNGFSPLAGLPPGPAEGGGFYLILAGAYMSFVAVLAGLMAKHPEVAWFPLLLAEAKLASSVLSWILFAFDGPYLIYATNGIVDGLIGCFALYFYRRIRRSGGGRPA